jgi:hypothetical protein
MDTEISNADNLLPLVPKESIDIRSRYSIEMMDTLIESNKRMERKIEELSGAIQEVQVNRKNEKERMEEMIEE